MKMRTNVKSSCRHIRWMMLALITLCFASCKDDDKKESGGFDADKPVIISSFTPEKGGLGTRLLVYGENFGTDASKIKVTIGGKSAKVVGSSGNSLYCIVPRQAYDGGIELKIVNEEGEELANTIADTKFTYVKKMIVSTVLGKKDDKGNYQVKDGPFEDCGGVGGAVWMAFDPKNHDHLYFVGEQHPFRMIDFSKRTLTTVLGAGYSGMTNMRTLSWTLDQDHLVISNDQSTETGQSNCIFSRGGGFKDLNVVTRSRACNGSAIHPVNGELYFNQATMGRVFRYDFETKNTEILFSVQDRDWDFTIQIHPTGNYAYIVVRNQHYILRTDYDWNSKKFTTPYVICGQPGAANWVDGVGKKARLRRPWQGAFVKNPEYSGREEEYDFYFCDRENHCVRILTAEGKVTTFAGRGGTIINDVYKGHDDGDLRLQARFFNPESIVYDEERKCFFIGDRDNRCIRKIGYEE